MKYLRRFPAEFALLFLAISSLSCASRPDEAIKLAQTAMQEAQQEQASDFAPGDWKSAQKAWDDAQTALTKQRYGEAATLLATSKSRFEKARTIAKAKREEVRKNVSTMQNTVNTRLNVLKNNISKSKLSGKSLRDLNDSCREVEAAIDRFNTEVLDDKLIQARSSGQVALQKLNEVEKKLAPSTKSPIY